MGGRRLAALAAPALVAACTGLAGLREVPNPVDGGTSDARPTEAAADRTVDARDVVSHEAADAPRDVRGDVARDGATWCPPHALFCDDFETHDFSRWNRPSGFGAATLGIDSVEVYRGSYAAHASMTVDEQDGSFVGSQRYEQKYLPPLGSGTFAMRAYVYLAEPQADTTAFFALTHQAAGTPDSLVITIDCANQSPADCGGTQGIAVTKSAFVMDYHFVASTLLTPMAWVCFEFVVAIEGSGTGRVTLYQDNVPILDQTTVTLDPGDPPYDAFDLGYTSTPGTQAQDVYVDDLVLAKERVGCEAP